MTLPFKNQTSKSPVFRERQISGMQDSDRNCNFWGIFRLAKSILDGDEDELKKALKDFSPDDKCVLINITLIKLQDIFKGDIFLK